MWLRVMEKLTQMAQIDKWLLKPNPNIRRSEASAASRRLCYRAETLDQEVGRRYTASGSLPRNVRVGKRRGLVQRISTSHLGVKILKAYFIC